MACEILSVEGAVFALWGKPTKADMDRIVDRIELIAKATGRPIVYVARVPRNGPAPDDDVRAYMNQVRPRFMKSCSSFHTVLEGSGFVSAFKRAVLTGLLQWGFRNGTFFVHETEKSISAKVERFERPIVEALLAKAAAQGLLTAPPPEDSLPTEGPRHFRNSNRASLRT